MTQRERERAVRFHLFNYGDLKQEIANYEKDIIYGSKEVDITGIHGTGISDPSAQKGMKLAEKSEQLRINEKWIEAIDDGMKELLRMDKGNERGYLYICKRMYGIPNRRFRQGTVRIAIECGLARSSIYSKLQTITNIMVFHAASKGLLK